MIVKFGEYIFDLKEVSALKVGSSSFEVYLKGHIDAEDQVPDISNRELPRFLELWNEAKGYTSKGYKDL